MGSTHFLICDLTVKELSVLGVDLLDLLLEALLLSLEELLVLSPHDGLLVVKSLLLYFAVLLLSHLSVEVLTGFNLALLSQVHAFLIFKAETEFTFLLVLVDLLVLSGLLSILTGDDGGSHPVHEVLSTLLTLGEFKLAVSLLLVKHAGVFLLGSNILLTLSFFLSQLLGFFLLVLFEHLLQVDLLLLSLVVEHLAFGFHLLLESVNQLEFLLVVLLLLNASSLLLKFELTVAAFLLHLDLGLVLFLLSHLLLTEELDVLTLHFVIFFSLRHFSTLGFVLLGHLVVQLFLNESLALLLAEEGLLLLLVV